MSKKLDFPTALLHPRHWLTWLGVAAFAPLAWLPWRTRRWLGMRIGTWIYRRNHKRRQVVLTNLRLCFPDWNETQRQAMALTHLREYAHALLDYSVLFFRSRQWLQHRTSIKGREHLEHAINANENIILLLAHSVWLEFAPVGIGQHYRAYGSYKPFPNPVLNWLIARSRLADVEFVIAREEGMMKLVRAFQPGRCLFFLPDEDHGTTASVFAPFFGVPKATLTTPARLSKLGKATALPMFTCFNTQTGKYEINIGMALQEFPSKNEVADASTLNQSLEKLIRNKPSQYMWLLKFFRTRPANENNVY
ncbi:LpxL/LpxP family acyltransferase [Candidatus Thiothrix anitrata]|uniref:Lipid A biosynthesis acyltransferase n=1 Tax=Candidatus Thiothrix anitrata TaxID=2823902 RepID=A0ABX7X5K0_9GAMM|nr:lipid A biosynthesis acyltransferase [Candidatus Thiothrix anitrata]QTR51155.1 lipid A biosynthesis acyltransferase [Candidatus Thiothrix anitrata]